MPVTKITTMFHVGVEGSIVRVKKILKFMKCLTNFSRKEKEYITMTT